MNNEQTVWVLVPQSCAEVSLSCAEFFSLRSEPSELCFLAALCGTISESVNHHLWGKAPMDVESRSSEKQSKELR